MKPLSYVVSMVQVDREDFSPSSLLKYGQYSINTYKDYVAFGISPTIEYLYATPNDIGVVNMPQDYEAYSKVGILLNGRVYTLTINRNMPFNRRWNDCGVELNDGEIITTDFINTQNWQYGVAFGGHYRAGNYVGEMYGIGGGFNRAGYFTEDWKLRRLQFANVPYAEVLIEYLSNNVSTQTIIDDTAIDTIRWGVHHQLSLFSSNQNDIERYGNMLTRAADLYRFRKTCPSVDEYFDELYRNTKTSPNR